MKYNEKFIIYIWIGSLISILILAILLCLQRPDKNVIDAHNDLLEVSRNIRRFYQNRPDYWGLNTSEVVKQNLYKGTVTNNQIKNRLGKPVVIGSDENGNQVMPGMRSFVISYRNLTKKECIELSSYRWREEDKLGLISLSIINNDIQQEFSWGGGLPVSRAKSKEVCKEDNHLVWRFE